MEIPSNCSLNVTPEGVKIFIIGDLHFKDDNVEATDLMTIQICEHIRKEKPDIICNMGDTTHKHDKFDLRPYHRAVKFFEQTLLCKPVGSLLIILIGNHDRENNKDFLTDIHAFNSLKMWPDTIVVDEVKKITHKGFNIVAVPYVANGRFAEALSTKGYATIPSEEPYLLSNVKYHLEGIHLVLAHQEFLGAKMTGSESKNGDIYPIYLPLCVSGHIHDYQWLLRNLMYPGTPVQHGFADTHDKTFSIFIFVNSEGKYSGEYTHQRVALNIPKKIQFTLTPQELLDFVPPENAYIKIKLQGTSEEIKSTMKLDYVKILLKRGIKITSDVIEQNIIVSSEEVVKTKTSFPERLSEAVKYQAIEVRNMYNRLFRS